MIASDVQRAAAKKNSTIETIQMDAIFCNGLIMIACIIVLNEDECFGVVMISRRIIPEIIQLPPIFFLSEILAQICVARCVCV